MWPSGNGWWSSGRLPACDKFGRTATNCCWPTDCCISAGRWCCACICTSISSQHHCCTGNEHDAPWIVCFTDMSCAIIEYSLWFIHCIHLLHLWTVNLAVLLSQWGFKIVSAPHKYPRLCLNPSSLLEATDYRSMHHFSPALSVPFRCRADWQHHFSPVSSVITSASPGLTSNGH